MNRASHARITEDLLRPLTASSRGFWLLVVGLGAVVAAGLGAWIYQMYRGFGMSGIRWPIFWGFYVTNFVFWIGISHAGTLISAILRLVNARWRRPVTRCAEAITVFALLIGAMFPIIHLGRPWLFFWLVPYPNQRGIWPNLRSPLVWDFFAISTYLTGSTLFLFLPMIPDLALVRDRTTGWRRRVYGALSLGWRGTTRQWHRLESAMQIMAIAILPVAISVHTIVSFDFSMAPVPMWHSTIFGPYFVAGAIFSGIAALILVMAVLRRALHLEAYLHPVHFENLGKLLLMMSLLWTYFVFAERLTVWYGNDTAEMAVFTATQHGPFAPLYWTMVICNVGIPFPILAWKKTRTIAGCVVASTTVLVGMWLERFLIIVPSLGHKYPRVQLGQLSAAAGGDPDHARDVRGHVAPLRALREARANHLGLGAESRRRPGAPGSAGPARGRRDALADAAVSALYALYPDPDAAQAAVNRLREEGVAPTDITVISSEPLEAYAFSHADRPTWMFGIAAGAGAAGLAFAVWLTRLTEVSWPLPTGGMPIVATWPNLVIMFELTMLSAVVCTVATLLVTAKLPRRRPRLYDPAVSDGMILVGVDRPRVAREAIERALGASGGPVTVLP